MQKMKDVISVTSFNVTTRKSQITTVQMLGRNSSQKKLKIMMIIYYF